MGIQQIQNASVPPKITFVSFQNNSDSYIDGNKFLNRMRTDLIKHCQGKIVFLDRAVIKEIEKENRDKLSGKRTSAPQEVTPYGVDFFLTGMVDSITNVAGHNKTIYRRFSFRLTDAASSAIIWEDDYEIKRFSHLSSVYE